MKKLLFALGLSSIAVLIGGCSHLGQEVVVLSMTGDCPTYQDKDWSAKADLLDSKTPTLELQCQLAYLRSTHDTAKLQSHLPSRICLLLAEREDDQATREKLAAEGVRFAEQAMSRGAEEDGRVLLLLGAQPGSGDSETSCFGLKKYQTIGRKVGIGPTKSARRRFGWTGQSLGHVVSEGPTLAAKYRGLRQGFGPVKTNGRTVPPASAQSFVLCPSPLGHQRIRFQGRDSKGT